MVTLHLPVVPSVLHELAASDPGPESIVKVTVTGPAPSLPWTTVASSVVEPGRSTLLAAGTSVTVAGLPATKALKCGRFAVIVCATGSTVDVIATGPFVGSR